MAKAKEKLENLSREELINVAQHLDMYKPEEQSREDLIKHILIIKGDKKTINNTTVSGVKMKLTRRTVLYHAMFISFIMISITITL